MSRLAPMQVRDSRRLTGPNLIWDRPGAVLDVALADRDAAPVIDAWQAQARRMLDAVGWRSEATRALAVPGGAMLALSAPMDGLYAATEVNEWAWSAAEAVLEGLSAPSLDEGAAALIAKIRDERNPALIVLREAAAARGVSCLSDDDFVSVGLGTGSRTWPARELPAEADIDWNAAHDVPVALITGTNGKTTTVRLLAAIAEAAGCRPGTTSTDGIRVGDELVEAGDYSGPGGARKLLRDRRVEVALLETARGGMLRRGLPVTRANAAVVTNVAEDHLGEFGVHDAGALADAKLVVARAIGHDGVLVLNADEPRLRARRASIESPIGWFSLDPAAAEVAAVLAEGRFACVLDAGAIVLREGGGHHRLLPANEVPAAFGGAARHNVANALAAAAAARGLGFNRDAIAEGLRRFDNSPQRNPGRANLWELGGVKVILDYAHNPHGLAAMTDMALALPAERRLVIIGQAGDRDDGAIRELARTAWRMQPDHVVIKELPGHLRGRALGEVPNLLYAEFESLGAGKDALTRVPGEVEAVRAALYWAKAGDLLLLLVHGDRRPIVSLIERLQAADWKPGQAVE